MTGEDHKHDVIRDYQTLLTAETFDHLGLTLNVHWPDWYQTLILALLERPRPHGDWLPGGFLFARPWLVYRDTEDYRSGRVRLFRDTAGSPSVEPIPWPPSYVVVGHHGDGSIIVDTASDEQALHEVYKESYTLRPFLNIRDSAESPQAFAWLILEAEPQ